MLDVVRQDAVQGRRAAERPGAPPVAEVRLAEADRHLTVLALRARPVRQLDVDVPREVARDARRARVEERALRVVSPLAVAEDGQQALAHVGLRRDVARLRAALRAGPAPLLVHRRHAVGLAAEPVEEGVPGRDGLEHLRVARPLVGAQERKQVLAGDHAVTGHAEAVARLPVAQEVQERPAA